MTLPLLSEDSYPPLFDRDGRTFLPDAAARSTWSASMLHGRQLAALAGHVIEEDYGGPEWQFSRLTTDLFRPAPLAPVEVTTQCVRAGKRIRVIRASLTVRAVEVAEATCLALRRSADPDTGALWVPGDWHPPAPESLPRTPLRDSVPGQWVPPFETRVIDNPTREVPRAFWTRENRVMVMGQELTPFVRAAYLADYASSAYVGPTGLQYINADSTLYLHRLPIGEWLGLRVSDYGGSCGIALGTCGVFDEHGPIGFVACSAVANQIDRA